MRKEHRAFYKLMREEYLSNYSSKLGFALAIAMYGTPELQKMVGLSAFLEKELTEHVYREDSLLARLAEVKF